jgi:pimeloyl-ACP methyl ester carboxylesterase
VTTPLILLHPFPFDGTFFRPLCRELADRTIHAPDLPGFGSEPVVPGITIDGMAEAMIAWMDRQSIPTAVVGGVSMGGYVALAIARKAPGRLAGLILIDTKADPDDDTAKSNRAIAIDSVQTNGVPAFVDAQLPKLVVPATRDHAPEIMEAIRVIGHKQSREGVVAGIAALRDRPDARPGLSRIACPTLIVVGRDDVITPVSQSEAMARSIPGSTLTVIPDCGHLAPMERPAEVAAAIRSFPGR